MKPNNETPKGETFIFFPTMLESINRIKNEKIQNRLFVALANFGVFGTDTDFSDIDPLGTLDAVFCQWKTLIEESKAHRQRLSEKRSEAGKKSGRPKESKNTENGKTETQTETAPNTRHGLPDAPEWLAEAEIFWQRMGYKSDLNGFIDSIKDRATAFGYWQPNWKQAARKWEAKNGN